MASCTPDALQRFLRSVLGRAGVDPAQADELARNLAWNDTAGRHNHGAERLPILLQRHAAGLIKAPCNTRIQKLAPAIAKLDAGNGLLASVAAGPGDCRATGAGQTWSGQRPGEACALQEGSAWNGAIPGEPAGQAEA